MKPLAAKIALVVVVFVVVTAIASLAGAKNLGTAMTFGQVGFGLTIVVLMLRGTRAAVEAAGKGSTDRPRPGR